MDFQTEKKTSISDILLFEYILLESFVSFMDWEKYISFQSEHFDMNGSPRSERPQRLFERFKS